MIGRIRVAVRLALADWQVAGRRAGGTADVALPISGGDGLHNRGGLVMLGGGGRGLAKHFQADEAYIVLRV